MMYITMSAFYLSLLGMAAMLVLKWREIKTGRPSPVSRLGAGSDGFFAAAYVRVERGFSALNRRSLSAAAHLAAYHVLRLARGIYVELKHRFISTPRGRRLMDAVRGRGEVSGHGASFYLRHIAETSRKSNG